MAISSPSKKIYARGTLGLSAGIVGDRSLDAEISARFGNKWGNETSGQPGANVGI